MELRTLERRNEIAADGARADHQHALANSSRRYVRTKPANIVATRQLGRLRLRGTKCQLNLP